MLAMVCNKYQRTKPFHYHITKNANLVSIPLTKKKLGRSKVYPDKQKRSSERDYSDLSLQILLNIIKIDSNKKKTIGRFKRNQKNTKKETCTLSITEKLEKRSDWNPHKTSSSNRRRGG
ncbi:PREDICTED: uncharacterized protein LOC108694372 [Atta colombica]|uniref:uncharacterized protein LOC108694372 n=1 Tax=Atta colombica TaxID=520822 RepID=UPI00084C5101|nr:PREDICTED: uncharacterized protein LOC108694372 [Atta colombica]